MGNATWLLISLPKWFFPSILDPMGAGMLSAIPALGIVCLVTGGTLGIAHRDSRLFLFALPALLSEILVAVAGALRGRVESGIASPIMLGFLGIQLILCGYLIYRLRGARLEAATLSIFSISYALFATFIAAMAFADNWV